MAEIARHLLMGAGSIWGILVIVDLITGKDSSNNLIKMLLCLILTKMI